MTEGKIEGEKEYFFYESNGKHHVGSKEMQINPLTVQRTSIKVKCLDKNKSNH